MVPAQKFSLIIITFCSSKISYQQYRKLFIETKTQPQSQKIAGRDQKLLEIYWKLFNNQSS